MTSCGEACSKTILVVDDDRDVREMIRTMLAGGGYNTIGAGNGQEALELLRGDGPQPDLILLDLMMPVMNGWQFQKAKAADPTISGLPLAISTVLANDAARTAELGAVDVLRKPSRIETLLDVVQRLCR